jgi:tetratricopeptide (TPR) repeat protein
VAARNALANATVETVIERTGGVPLFVEELTRAVLESGSMQLAHREIPATLHDSLMARLDRLGTAKEVAQVAAVLGSEFSYELLHAVHTIAETELRQALSNLADAELVYVRGIAPEATYQFKHALIRDAAYEALLKSRRKELHRLVAMTIDEKFPDFKQAHPEVLARHWTEASEIERAIAEWQRAGSTAEARNAFAEAAESYRQALILLSLQPDSAEREIRELELTQSIIRPRLFTSGYSAPETIQAIEHAVMLAEKSGSLKQLVDLILWRRDTYVAAGDYQAALALADRALELALREGSAVSIACAQGAQVHVRFWRGDHAGAEKHFMAGLKFFEDPEFIRLPEDPARVFGTASWNAWIVGRADIARQRETRMMAVVKTNPYGTAWAGAFAAILGNLLREYEKAEALAAQALDFSEQHQFPGVAASCRFALGFARFQLKGTAEGVELIRQGMAEWLGMGVRVGFSAITAWLASALARQGEIAEARETLEQAFQVNPQEKHWEPEIFRIRGELRLQQGQTELAAADFRDAIAVAEKTGAKAWELRATTSLARLLASQGHREQARSMLAEIYGWFTEGFDTADLKDAKALLDELGV